MKPNTHVDMLAVDLCSYPSRYLGEHVKSWAKRRVNRQERHNQKRDAIRDQFETPDHVPTLAEIAANQQALDDMLIAAKKPCAYCGGKTVWALSTPRVTVKKHRHVLPPPPALILINF